MGSEFNIGDRIRVTGRGDNINGAHGEVAAHRDEFGRYGLRLDGFKRARPHWLHWVHPDFIESEPPSTVEASQSEGEAPR